MHNQTLKRLEFNKILELLALFCISELGRELILSLQPMTELEPILQAQALTTEGRELLRLEPLADLGGWSDIRLEVQRAGQGAVLEPRELLAVAQTMEASRRCKNFFTGRQERYPLLSQIGLNAGNFAALEKKIFLSILPDLEISDQASTALGGIRRRLRQLKLQVKEQLDALVRSPEHQKYLQEPLVTMREGRYVVPVKQEFRAHVSGIIHDQSSSGATVFVEPMAAVGVNNEIRRLKAAEKQEINRILASLSAQVAAAAEDLQTTLSSLAQLDFVLAKARYSQELDAVEPLIESRPSALCFKKARHPLLGREVVVPIDVRLGEDFDTLIITGPNTGGKTVVLKTAGLLVLMAQSGLHIPVQDGSWLGIFVNVFADIGDEQSIEQSLSTFSSHMRNIVYVLQEAGACSLVLMDELGAGTDPTEGAALAQAILEKLQDNGAKTIVTTHYNKLKEFAYSRGRVENASVEFDTLTLKPTFRLLTGRPGGSQAFEIASRLGMSVDLVTRARDFLDKDQVVLADLISKLERDRHLASLEEKEARRLKEDALELKRRYGELEKSLLARREEILEKAVQEAKQLVRQTRNEVEEIIEEMRTRSSEEEKKEREKAIFEIRQKLQGVEGKIVKIKTIKTPKKKVEGEIPLEVTAGQEVYLPDFNQYGFVTAPVADGQAQVQVGAIKLTLPLKELRLAPRESSRAVKQREFNLAAEKARVISNKLDLRGLRAEEALLEVEKYLDDATLASLPRVYLVHGKGTGALRAAIQRQLKDDRRVKSFRLGVHGEGGEGVTVIELK